MTKVADYHNRLCTRDTPAEQWTKTPPISNSENKILITSLYGFITLVKVYAYILRFRIFQRVHDPGDCWGYFEMLQSGSCCDYGEYFMLFQDGFLWGRVEVAKKERASFIFLGDDDVAGLVLIFPCKIVKHKEWIK